MSKGTVHTPIPPSSVPRSPMSPISQTPGVTGAAPRIPLPAGVVPPFPRN